jgi:hypothetical protein
MSARMPEAPQPAEAVLPTPEEAANGWTRESLALYLAERERAAAGVIAFDPAVRQRRKATVQNSSYRRMRWRG